MDQRVNPSDYKITEPEAKNYIIELLRQHPYMTPSKIAFLANLPPDRVRRILNKLYDDQVLMMFDGANNRTYWCLKEDYHTMGVRHE